jgi:outer membrane protein OmpA-like peptidoglycan-associated protein
MQFSIGYHPGAACCDVATPPPPPPPPANQPPTATCDVERPTLAPGEKVGLRAVASDPDGDALSYAWTTDAGRIDGSGASVSLDTGGITPPADVTARVRVSDGRGGVAEATCGVRIPAPERQPETVSCNSDGFPHNLARLNNVDKACLDDVVSRLSRDPRSRVTIVGYADAAERRPELLARQRAEAAKVYLVDERGVEEARVSVRAAEPQVSVGPGSARGHRRVELIFVPAGAVPSAE